MSYFTPLQPGDEIRVVAPSSALASSKDVTRVRGQRCLDRLGFKMTFGTYLDEQGHLGSATAIQRATDLIDAYRDKRVRAILALTGGWLANEILPLLDWETIRSNPKPLIGYSDITVLLNAIYAKTGTVNLLGPNLSTLGHNISLKYTLGNLVDALTGKLPRTLNKSTRWGLRDEPGLHRTGPWKMIAPGSGKGILIGGNIATLYLLQGTEYMPRLDRPFILAIEDDDQSKEFTLREFSRRLESLLQQPGFRANLQGMLIGRFQPTSKVGLNDLRLILESKNLGKIPIIANMDFGHTLPMLTLPIGGYATIDAEKNKCRVIIDTQPFN